MPSASGAKPRRRAPSSKRRDRPNKQQKYAFTYKSAVQFRDVDALAHVNNAVYLTYFESARIAYWLRVTKRSGLDALDMILAHVEVDYRSPLHFGDYLVIGVRCASISRSSFVLEFRMTAPDGRLVAEARKVLVYYDFEGRRPRPIPPRIRRALLRQDPGASQSVSAR